LASIANLNWVKERGYSLARRPYRANDFQGHGTAAAQNEFLLERSCVMTNEQYSPEELAKRYQIGVQQAARYIVRFGADRKELDALLGSSSRTPIHRSAEIERTAIDVAIG
jgi:hypothetical protein